MINILLLSLVRFSTNQAKLEREYCIGIPLCIAFGNAVWCHNAVPFAPRDRRDSRMSVVAWKFDCRVHF